MAYANDSAIAPADHVTVAPSRYRERIEAAIESLIALLDEIDGDPDLEDGHDAEAIDEREPEQEGYDPFEAPFVMDQTEAEKAWAS